MPALFFRLRALPLCFLLAIQGQISLAEDPSLAFDFGRTAECRDVTSEVAANLYPGEKIVELKLRVSVHLLAGNLAKVEEIHIEVGDYDLGMRVHSFEPSTQLESNFSEAIHWTKTVETGKAIGASLGGEVPVLLGDVVAHITPTVNGKLAHREVVTETQKRVAPKQVVVVSGTLGQEHGVFFKWRSSPLTSLEGVHELTVRFVVPEEWRGDSLRVCCQATGQEKFLWIKQPATWANICAPLTVYLAGDEQARTAAKRYAQQSISGS